MPLKHLFNGTKMKQMFFVKNRTEIINKKANLKEISSVTFFKPKSVSFHRIILYKN